MSEQPPSGPSDDPSVGRPTPSPDYGQPSYPAGYGNPSGYPGASGGLSLDLGRIVFVAAWVVLGLFVLSFLYGLGQEYNGEDVGDRLFGLMPELGTGVFYSGLLLGVSAWLSRNS